MASNTPIFDSIDAERGYESLVRWTPPAFVWGPRFVVQLDKQPQDMSDTSETIWFKPALEVQTLSGAPYGGPTRE